MRGTLVGTTKGTHGEHTDFNETIPDGGRISVRVRWQALSVTAGLLQPLHHEDEMNHGQTRYTRTGIFRQWTAVLMRGICTICKHMGIRPLDIQSRYQQSNGLAEKAVQTAKRIVMKATASGRDRYIALLEYRTTPISDCGKSPVQLLMRCRLRYILHSTPASLKLVLVNPEDTQLRFEEKEEKQKTFYDRNARNRAGISVGDQILTRKNSGGYQSAVVTDKTDAPRSYNVRTKDRAIYRRTSLHLKKPRHYAGEVSRTSAPEALRCEIPREPQLSVIRGPAISNVMPPNQPAEVPVADIPVVPSEVNNFPLRLRYGRIYKPPIRYET